jgi:hypothetical protein
MAKEQGNFDSSDCSASTYEKEKEIL